MAVYPKHLGKHQIEPSFWCFKDKVMKKTVKLGKKTTFLENVVTTRAQTKQTYYFQKLAKENWLEWLMKDPDKTTQRKSLIHHEKEK